MSGEKEIGILVLTILSFFATLTFLVSMLLSVNPSFLLLAYLFGIATILGIIILTIEVIG